MLRIIFMMRVAMKLNDDKIMKCALIVEKILSHLCLVVKHVIRLSQTIRIFLVNKE